MELKIFGKKVFEFKGKKSEALVYNSTESLKNSKFLPDFHTFRANTTIDWASQFVAIPTTLPEAGKEWKKKKEEEKKKASRVELTPKGVYELKLLNDTAFKLNTDMEYVDKQLQQFKDKLDLIQVAEYDISRGTNEIASIIVRMENRKKYAEYHDFFENFAYTTPSKIDGLLKAHDYLQLGKVEQFLADMPQEAVDVMKEYTSTTRKLCGKQPVFYIVANKKDFQKVEKRRDPILLVQSPFGHFWQILGAWGVEDMFLLEEL